MEPSELGDLQRFVPMEITFIFRKIEGYIYTQWLRG